jgi:hypothetical protein
MSFVVVTPPPAKPSEPGLSAAAAARILRHFGAEATSVDASIGWHRFALAPTRLTRTLATLAEQGLERSHEKSLARAVRHLAEQPLPLQRRATYQSRRVYTSAVADLERALAIAASGYPGVRLGVASVAYVDPPLRLESKADLTAMRDLPSPFDEYFERELLPSLAHARTLAVSVTFQQQVPVALRLLTLARASYPKITRVLGGPMVACWLKNGHRMDGPPFDVCDQVLAGTDAELAELAARDRAQDGLAPLPTPRPWQDEGPLSVPLADANWEHYLTPEPSVPLALARGCYWRRCTFCPDYLHRGYDACAHESLAPWLRFVAQRFPGGAMLHLTDSALPADALLQLARVIARERLPLRWHGFVRVEPALADPAFVAQLAEGGCVMLQLGVETGSPRLLELLGKGATVDLARRVLTTTAAAGIKNQVYLLFGVPTETDVDRELTLAMVESLGPAIFAINASLLNLPRKSPMHRHPERFGISAIMPFSNDADLSLYEDFRSGDLHPRVLARHWLDHRFDKSLVVRRIRQDLRSPFAANHLCFLPAS